MLTTREKSVYSCEDKKAKKKINFAIVHRNLSKKKISGGSTISNKP